MGLMAQEIVEDADRYYRRHDPGDCSTAWVCGYQSLRGEPGVVGVEAGDTKVEEEVKFQSKEKRK